MKRASAVGVGGARNDLWSINAPERDASGDETVSKAPVKQAHRQEPVDVNHPSFLGASPNVGGVANCGVCQH